MRTDEICSVSRLSLTVAMLHIARRKNREHVHKLGNPLTEQGKIAYNIVYFEIRFYDIQYTIS